LKRVLVVANETVAGEALVEAVKRRKARGPVAITVLCPVNPPREGYVVYTDTRRAAAGRRLEQTLQRLRGSGVPAHGFVIDCGPVDAVRDELARESYDEIVVSTHPVERSGWVRRHVVDQIRRAAGATPVDHVVADPRSERGATKNVLVVANETVLAKQLLDAVRARAAAGDASFLIIAPQGFADSSYEDAERRLRRAVAELRDEGIDAHGQIVHPDPYTAVMQTVRDERVDALIVSTYPRARSGWLRRDLVHRLRKDTRLPVQHIVSELPTPTLESAA
jgi:hypothetical protein